MTLLLYFLSLAGLIFLLILIVSLGPKPRNDRDWQVDYEVLPRIDIRDEEVTVHDLRDFRYSKTEVEVAYDTRTYDLAKLESLWLVLESFSRMEAVGHTLLSFGFSDGEYLAVSIEARLTKGERYDLLRGLFRSFELIYQFGSERDFIARRTTYLDHDVYLYPVRAAPRVTRQLLLDYLYAADTLTQQPRFYNTLFDNCTGGIVKHVTKVDPSALSRYTVAQVAPGWSDRVLYSKGLIYTELPFEALRAHFNVKEKATAFAADPDFSQKIREGL